MKFIADDKIVKLCNHDVHQISAYFMSLVMTFGPHTRADVIEITLENGNAIKENIILN